MTHPQWQEALATQGAQWSADGTEVLHFGDPDAERDAHRHSPVCADLSALGLIRVSGEDAADFLQSQLSNDVLRLDEDHSELAAWCDAKGRVLAILRLLKVDDAYLLLLPGSLLDTTLKRLQMFVLRAKVTLEDVSSRWLRLGLLGPDADKAIGPIAGPPASNAVVGADATRVAGLPGPSDRYLILTPDAALGRQLLDTARPVGFATWRLADIDAGQPQVYPQTRETFIPQMLNLHWLGAVDFKKGCYPGQEVVARLQYRGRLKQRLHRIRIAAAATPEPGTSIVDTGGRSQGTLLDAAAEDDVHQRATAVLRVDAADGPLRIDSDAVEVLSLPYATPD